MAPKKGKKISLNEFLGDSALGSWADEMESLPSAPAARNDDDYGRPGDRHGRRDDFLSSRPDRVSGPPREDLPLPTAPPYTAFIGNLAFDLVESELEDFFATNKPKSVKIIKDRDDKPKGFGYVEFEDLDGLKDALARSGSNFSGRTIRVSVAEPPKERSGFGGGDEGKFDNPWRRDGPLPDLPSRDSSRRRFDGPRSDDRLPSVSESPSDWRSNMPSRPAHSQDDGPVRRRKDPGFEGSSGAADREDSWTMGSRFKASEDTGSRFGSARGRGDMGPPREPVGDDFDWRKPKSLSRSSTSPTNSTPPTPQMRRKLELLPRSGSASGTPSPLSSPKIGPTSSVSASSRSNPFGAAKPVDVSGREQEVIERLEKDREHNRERLTMSRTNSRTASERPPMSRTSTPPISSTPSSPQPSHAIPKTASNVRPSISFAHAAAKKEAKAQESDPPKEDAEVETVTAQVAQVEV